MEGQFQFIGLVAGRQGLVFEHLLMQRISGERAKVNHVVAQRAPLCLLFDTGHRQRVFAPRHTIGASGTLQPLGNRCL